MAPETNSAAASWSRVPLLAAAVAMAVFSLTRLLLTIHTGTHNVPLGLWPGIFAKGLLFDAVVTTLLVAPVCLYEAVLPNRWRDRPLHRALRIVWLWLAVALLLFGAVAEATFWIEFSTRFNFIAVDYLIYTQEVIGNIRQSYPVPLILSAIALSAAAIAFALRAPLRRAGGTQQALHHRLALVLAAFALPAAGLTLTDADQMQGLTHNAYGDELSGNGLFTFASAMRRNELDYDKFYLTIAQDQADATLKQLGVERQPLSVALKMPPDPDLATDEIPFSRRPKNVVLISVESLSASFLGAYGAHDSFTPRLDAIARDGLKFDRAYATGTRTVRGLEALSLGTPPVPGQAIVRRPGNEHLATLGEILAPQQVASYFFYGGYGYFDNMNAYFDANNYHVIDRTDIPKQGVVFENVWGVADEVLFSHVLKTLDKGPPGGESFFAHIMTTSNHRPYSYPDGRIDIKSPGGREGAVRYTDYAIGKFLDDARGKPWFKDTLFIITADHCASVAGKSKLPVDNYHIPLIFYAPDMLQPGTFRTMVSQIDLPPTIVEMLGKSGDDHFFGRSFFEDGPPVERAFISNYQELGYLRNGMLTVLLPKKKVESFRIDPVTFTATPAEVDPLLLNEAIAYYQTASRAYKTGALRRPPPLP